MRLTSKREIRSDPLDIEITHYSFDPLYRLAEAITSDGNGMVKEHEEFSYDGLGNLIEIKDHIGSKDLSVVAFSGDRDRICKVNRPQRASVDAGYDGVVAFETGTVGEGHTAPDFGVVDPDVILCEYRYDALGNVVGILEEGRPPRSFTYDGASRLLQATSETTSASYRYGPFGEVAELNLTGPMGTRHDIRYGPRIEKTTLSFPSETGTPSTTFVEFRIPGPTGTLATQRGEDWFYWHGDGRGNRVITGNSEEIVQETDYRPFGEIKNDTGTVLSNSYTKYLWNFGDRLKALGLVQLGPRLYNPETGRFLQRDPFLRPRTANTTHPYSFSWNDPVNFADPSGLQSECIGKECRSDAVASALAGGLIWLWSKFTPFRIGGDSGSPEPLPDPVAPAVEPVSPWKMPNIRSSVLQKMVKQGGPTDFEREVLKGGWVEKVFDTYRWRLDYRQWYDFRSGRILGYTTIGSVKKTYDRYGNLLSIDEPGLETGFWYDPIDFAAGSGFARKAATRLLGGAVSRGSTALATAFGDDAAALVANVPKSIATGPADTYVYLGIRNGEPVYVGLTNNIARRQSEHGARFVLRPITQTPVTRLQARAIEQALIVRNPHFENIKNSISPKHSWYDEAVSWGEAWLQANGY